MKKRAIIGVTHVEIKAKNTNRSLDFNNSVQRSFHYLPDWGDSVSQKERQ